MEKVYIIGHKSPDLDSVAAAISYAAYRNASENTGKYVPAVAGGLNKETKFALEKFNIPAPELLESADGKDVILVDHNEFSQAVDGIETARILGVVDHHKVGFKYGEPILFVVMPWGSSCSIIAHMFDKNGIELDANMAGLMLSAVLVDTVITKSPTCVETDKDMIKMLADKAGIADWQQYGMELFKVRSNVAELETDQIIKSDYKDFEFKGGKFGIGQVETVSLDEFAGREDDILAKLETLRITGNYHSVVLFITDIIKEGSEFFVSTTDQTEVEKALGAPLTGGRVYIPGILSRKKQVAPKFGEVFDK